MTSEYQTRIILKNVRGSYVKLTDQQLEDNQKYLDKQGKNEKAYASIQLIIPKDHPQIDELKTTIEEAKKKGRAEGKLPKNENAKLKLPLRDGDEPNAEGESRGEAYENCYFINANNRFDKPGLLNRHKELPTEQDLEEYCYSGAYFHVSLNFYPFANPEQKGIAAAPNNVMFYKKGEKLGGTAPSASSDFSAITVEEDDLDDLDDF